MNPAFKVVEEEPPYSEKAPPDCPFCDQPVTVWKGNGDPMARCIAVTEEGLKWAHVGCVHFKRGGKRTPVEGFKERRQHPPCALCGQAWEDHGNYGYATRCCSDEPGDDRLYHRAIGKAGPEPIAVQYRREMQAIGGDYRVMRNGVDVTDPECGPECSCRALIVDQAAAAA